MEFRHEFDRLLCCGSHDFKEMSCALCKDCGSEMRSVCMREPSAGYGGRHRLSGLPQTHVAKGTCEYNIVKRLFSNVFSAFGQHHNGDSHDISGAIVLMPSKTRNHNHCFDLTDLTPTTLEAVSSDQRHLSD